MTVGDLPYRYSTPQDLGVQLVEPGLDTVRWGGPIEAVHNLSSLEALRCHNHPDVDTGELISSTEIMRLPGGARIWVEHGRHGFLGKLEVSLPKHLRGSNLDAVPLGDALEVMKAVHDQAREYVTWKQVLADLRPYRVDVDQDFVSVDQITMLLGAMERDPSVRNRSMLHEDPTHSGALTLERYTASWSAKLYDKAGEVRNRSRRSRNADTKASALRDLDRAQGRLRYEAQLKAAHLKKIGLVRVADLANGLVVAEARRLFHSVGFGREVADMQAVLAKLEHGGITGAKKYSILGWLVAHGAGEESSDLSPNTIVEYKKVIRTLNIAPADLGASFTGRRLDFDTSTVVEVAA